MHDHRSNDARAVRLCPRCGYVEIPWHGPVPSVRPKARYRRELTMARLGVELLGRPDPSVLIWRPGDAATERYDVVVAADAIGQFRDPHVDFIQLFSRLNVAGLLICSTQIYDGGDLERRRYVFGPGHASYYSQKSLRRIAAVHELKVHLRMPTVAAEQHRRRRYVVFTPRRDARREAARGSTNPNALA